MASIFLALTVLIVVYVLATMLLPRSMTTSYSGYTSKALERIYRDSGATAVNDAEGTITRDMGQMESQVVQSAYQLPFLDSTLKLVLKAGYAHAATRVLLIMIALFFLFLFLSAKMGVGVPGFFVSLLLAYWLPRVYLRGRIQRRSDKFINMFPDALDMIVRSVRSGFPLNTALRMIADNMEDPIASEFRQVVDEVSYGRSLTESLQRLAARIDQPDIQFFVVVLAVQQESGGNLAEVLNNLSSVIRARKQLRLKIKAMTSEGRATGWVLGSLPVFIFALLWFVSPGHLQPLFDTTIGNIMFAGAIGLVVLSAVIVRQMIRIDI